MKFIKKYWWLLLVFVGSFICIYFLGFMYNYGDPTACYGFSYAILKGEIPYLDFNMVITPLYPFVMSIGLFISNNYITFLLEQSLIITLCFLTLYKLFGNKSFVMIFLTFVTIYANIISTYNFFCFFIMILIIYLENKYKDKDYLIGFLIALSILTKQSVGVFFIIPSIIFYHKNLGKLKRRFIGFLVPCCVFLIYLVANKCLYQFIDLCFLGLFDFFNNNGVGANRYIPIYLILTVIGILTILLMILKNKNDINLYYLLGGFSFAFPVFDHNHFMMFLNCIVVCFLPYIKINDKIIKRVSLVCFFLGSSILAYFHLVRGEEIVFTKELKHFEYFLIYKNEYKTNLEIEKFFDKFNDKNNIILSYASMSYKIHKDKKITYFDTLNRGNYGFNGTNKMIKKIKKMHNYYIIVSLNDFESSGRLIQFDKEIVKYVMDNCERVETNKKLNYAVYYKK